MAETKKSPKKKVQKCEVIHDYQDKKFSELYQNFVNKEDIEVLQTKYFIRNNEYVCYVEYMEK